MAAVPLLLGVLAAYDTAMTFAARERLRDAMQSAAVLVANSEETDTVVLKTMAEEFIRLNLKGNSYNAMPTVTVTEVDGIITVSGSGEINSIFFQLLPGVTREFDTFGQATNIMLGTGAELEERVKPLEVALVFDESGSMNSGNRLWEAKEAVRGLLDVLWTGYITDVNPHVEVSIVPFNGMVNINDTIEPLAFVPFEISETVASWLDIHAEAKYHGAQFEGYPGTKTNHFKLYNSIDAEWKGCVEARPTDNDYDIKDIPPTDGDPDSFFVPTFARITSKGSPDNNYLPGIELSLGDKPDTYFGYINAERAETFDPLDATTGILEEHIEHAPRAADIDEEQGISPNRACGTPILPLTQSKQDILDHLALIDPIAHAMTNMTSGLAWGWRTVTDKEPFSQADPADPENLIKAVVLLTDGDNVLSSSYPTSYGWLSEGRLNGRTGSSSASNELDDRMLLLCENIKDDKVRLYTVGFKVTEANAALLKTCAIDGGSWHVNSAEELANAFLAIAKDLKTLVVRR